MSASIFTALDSLGELAAHIFQGNEAHGFVQRERCLFLADQVAARMTALSDDLRKGRLPEALALQALGGQAAFRARLTAFDEVVAMAVSAASDTMEAIIANDFRKARQRVSEGVYALWQLNAALEVMRAPAFSPPVCAAGPVNPQWKGAR